MKRVLVVSTGDTIAQLHSGVEPCLDLVARVRPDVLSADVHAEDMMAEPSWDTSAATMLALARRVRAAVLDEHYSGVVVAHGVDTLCETAYLADLLAGAAAERGGIVFTGAVRHGPPDDGTANLRHSVLAAADPALRGLGAVVCAGGELHAARWASLVDTTAAAPFSSAPRPPLGRVTGERVEIAALAPPRPPRATDLPETDVALLKTYPGMPPALLTAVADAGARGIVLEGTGTGNVPVDLLTTIDELTGWDIPVVLASRAHTRADAAELAPYEAGLATKVGAISARGLAPSQARCALMVALGTGGVDAVRTWFALL
ncbi:asparaginase [Amycolatopsis sp. CA-230715]|uniref:asparaginase n=1 Tax=Amycolatopsis sp. CA-230715 TaxID=2745196 RepID=UPI001C009A12|nr:asparaginase domain-containing protein [Amycolatopsis sp. CA-230715]QWF83754.1 L-asparaginase [Amycolatopsis sp. CA-230715]